MLVLRNWEQKPLSLLLSFLATRKKDDKEKKKKYSLSAATLVVVAAVITTASSFVITSNIATPAGATTTQPPSPPVTATTDNESVNVLINWEPREIEPNQDIDFTLDFQDPSSGESIPHVNYNFEIKDENGETIQSMTDLHTHSGSDMQTVTFDTTGRFNLVVTIIGTGINPPFDTTKSGTAQTTIMVGQESTVAPPDSNNTAATTTDNTTTISAPSSEIELSPQLVYKERVGTVSQIPINQTHTQLIISGNGTLTLPNGTETINTTSTGSIIVSQDGTGVGKEMLSTEDGTENATGTFYEIARFNMENGTGRGIIIALVHTNSTGKLAPLDGMILAGQQEFTPEPTSSVTLWEWQSGVPYVKMQQTTMQQSLQ
jgi:hypothetical protein